MADIWKTFLLSPSYPSGRLWIETDRKTRIAAAVYKFDSDSVLAVGWHFLQALKNENLPEVEDITESYIPIPLSTELLMVHTFD